MTACKKPACTMQECPASTCALKRTAQVERENRRSKDDVLPGQLAFPGFLEMRLTEVKTG